MQLMILFKSWIECFSTTSKNCTRCTQRPIKGNQATHQQRSKPLRLTTVHQRRTWTQKTIEMEFVALYPLAIKTSKVSDAIIKRRPTIVLVGGQLTLYDLGMHFDIRPGDVFFFRSRQIIHGNQPLIKGVRNSLVFFMHEIGVSDYFKRIGQPSRAIQALREINKNKMIQRKRKLNRQKAAKDLINEIEVCGTS